MKTNNNIYTETVIIPSNGLLNPEIPNGEVTLRCVTLADQKYISGSNASGDTILHELLRRCVVSPEGFDPTKLTSTDTFYLTTKLRILSYGGKYSFNTRCPECGKKFTVDLNLSNLVVESLDPDYLEDMKVVLPNKGDTVYTKLLTNKEEDEVEKEAKRLSKKFKDSGDFEFEVKLAKSITKIELKEPNKLGETVLTSPLDIQEYIVDLTDLDAMAISSTLSPNYGIQTVLDYVCPECREDIEVGMRFTAQYFRPKYENFNR